MTRPAPARPLLLLGFGAIAWAAFRIGQSRTRTALSHDGAEWLRLKVIDLAHSRDLDPQMVVKRAETYLDFVAGLTTLKSWVRAVTPQECRHED